MGKLIIPIEIETDGMLEDALEIKRLADELGRKVYNFRIKASANSFKTFEIMSFFSI